MAGKEDQPLVSPPIFVPAPADLLSWTSGAVVARLPVTLTHSHFPASVDGMVVLRTQGQVMRSGRESLLPELALIGPLTRPVTFVHAGAVCTYGLLLAPHTVSFLSGRFNKDTAGQDLDLRALRPQDADDLYRNWKQASGDEHRCNLLFDWLRNLIRNERNSANRWANLAGFPLMLMKGNAMACKELGVGRRQLERLSRQFLGMSPHQVRTLMRALAILSGAMAAKSLPKGADLALIHGYWDQSHLSRDLKKLVGMPLGRTWTASHSFEDGEWPLNVGRQQFTSQANRGGPDTAATQTPAPHQSTSIPTARACTPVVLERPKR